MKLGVVFPQTEIGSAPAVIRDYAQAAESAGYDHLLVFDHVLGGKLERFDKLGRRPPYTDESPFHEVFVLFGYLAACTQRLELVTGIVILPQRQTALVAKQAAAVDVLADGRLRLGVGIGWNHVEYEALNENFHTRGRRVSEQIAVMRKLWTEPVVNFHGSYHHLDRAGINPLPVQRPIPVWMGGMAEPVLKRVAEMRRPLPARTHRRDPEDEAGARRSVGRLAHGGLNGDLSRRSCRKLSAAGRVAGRPLGT